MTKISHMSDIHIRPYSYLDEIEYTFERLYEELEKRKPDLNVICGDLYHNKLMVSNEYFDCCFRFLSKLKQIAPTIVTIGNHDVALQNLSRMDAITPVVNALSQEGNEILLLKNSESFESINNICFHHFSCLDDRSKWPNKLKLEKNKINIALYHGSINGSSTDDGWISRGNKDNIEIFDGFDYALLGDIHKYQFITPKIAYPGSLRQNNYSEDQEKGFIFWNIRDKNDFDTEFVILPQKHYFFTIHLNPKEKVPEDLGIPEGNRIRVKLSEKASYVREIEIKNQIQSLYKPKNEVNVISPQISFGLQTKKLTKEGKIENIRSSEAQKRLLKRFFENKATRKEIKEIIKLDKEYQSQIDGDVLRNVIWKINKFSWNNLFCYGKNNQIDFQKTNGIVGIYGNSGTGKSSIIDAICYTLFNSINKKGAIKNSTYVNNKEKKASAVLEISMGDEKFQIVRETENKENYKGETLSSNFVDFSSNKNGQILSLNGETSTETNKNIKNYFGMKDDFNTISLISQWGLAEFIDEGATEKKKAIAKFLDLGIFEDKFQIANDFAKKLKEKVDLVNDVNFVEEIKKTRKEISEAKKTNRELKIKKTYPTNQISNLEEQIDKLKSQIKIIPKELDSTQKSVNEGLVKKWKSEFIELDRKLQTVSNEIDDINRKHNNFRDYEILHQEFLKRAQNIFDYDFAVSNVKSLDEHTKILVKIPNVPECRTCPLVQKAYEYKDKQMEYVSKAATIHPLLDEKRSSELVTMENDYKLVSEKLKDKQKFGLSIENLEMKIAKYQALVDEADQAKVDEEKNYELRAKINDKQHLVEQYRDSIKSIEKDLNLSIKKLGGLEERLKQLRERYKQAKEITYQYHLYKLYLEAMGKNGIAYMIMSEKLEEINHEVNHILAQITTNRVLIENDEQEKTLEIFLISNKGKTPIQLCSGAEKTLVAISLRAALWNITPLPKSPILILDESFVFLDAETLQQVQQLLSLLKSYFSHILIISHNEEVKSWSDYSLYIESKDGYSRCIIQ